MCIRVHLCVVCAFVQCLGRPGDGLGALELKLGGCEGGEAHAVPSWRRVCSSGSHPLHVYIFKQEPDCTKEHFPNAGPSGWDKQQALSTRVRTVHTESTGRRLRRGES